MHEYVHISWTIIKFSHGTPGFRPDAVATPGGIGNFLEYLDYSIDIDLQKTILSKEYLPGV